MLIRIGRILNVKPSYFMASQDLEIVWTAYRCQTRLTKTLKSEIEAIGASQAEKYMAINDLIFPDFQSQFDHKIEVNTEPEADIAADSLRKLWNLGTAPIDSLTKIFENKGGIIVEYPLNSVKFDGLSGWVNSKCPIIVINSAISDDRIRFNIGHEIGHLIMSCNDVDSKTTEKLAHRFSGAFLLPTEVIKKELGDFRRSILPKELAELKVKYGLSMQACLFRAFNAGIINESTFNRLFREFSAKGWRKKEPVMYEGNEKPSRLRQILLRALAENLVSQEKAEEVLPNITAAINEDDYGTERRTLSPTTVLKLPVGERAKLLRKAADKMKEEYENNKELTSFDAFKENDLYDYEDFEPAKR